MTDDDLIRDAVHELVAAAPAPKPLPARSPHSAPSYRWLAIAAAVILVVGGIVALTWLDRGGDEDEPVATAPPLSTTTPPTDVPSTSVPTTAEPPDSTSAPETPPTPTTTLPATTAPVTAPPPVTDPPETLPSGADPRANLLDYLSALADGRYDDAATFLRSGGLEDERRSGMRPLFTEFGTTDDLPARLAEWCSGFALCTPPDSDPIDIGSYWLATWTTPSGTVSGYFRSSEFEGMAVIEGIPPRRPDGPVTPCPTSAVVLVREAALDAAGVPETIVVTRTDSTLLVNVCNTSLAAPPLELPPSETPVAGVLQPASETTATLLIGESGETGVCAATYRLAASAGALVQVGWDGCWGFDGTESVGCRDIGGVSQIVGYEYTFVGGTGPNDSTAMDVDAVGFDGTVLESFTLSLPDQIDEALQIIEPTCNGLPVVTEA